MYIAEDSANEYIFDYDALRRFNIKTKYLPENSKVLNHPLNIVKRYKDIFIIVVLYICNIDIFNHSINKVYKLQKQYEKEIIKAKIKQKKLINLKDIL